MTLDLNLLLQGAALALLCFIGKAVYNGAVLQAATVAKLDAHTKQDAENFERLHEEITTLRERL